jgi:tetratricopeptide (TPR) repeat protein
MVGMNDGLRGIASAFSSRSWLQLLSLLALIIVVLSPTLDAGFLWDDFEQIVYSPTIGDLSLVPFFFTHNVAQSAGGEGRGADGVDTYRPVFFVALTLIHTISGADPFWFHFAVLAAHLAVCMLLWLLAVRWLEEPLAAWVAVLFFGCHPVTAEAYLWSSALSEPLAAAGLLAAVLILDRQCGGERSSGGAWAAALVSGLVFLTGLLAKEVVLTALPAVSLFLVMVRRVRLRFLAPVWLAAAAFLVMRGLALAGLQATGIDPTHRLAAIKIFPVLVLDGLRAVVTMQPVGIRHLSWEYATITWSQSLAAAAIGILLLGGAVVLRRRAPLALTAALIMGSMLLPIALVATVPGWGGFGRYLYVPLAFSVLAFAQLGLLVHRDMAPRRPRLRWAVPVVVVAVLFIEQLGLRHALWVYANQENLARAAIEIFPNGPDGWRWLGDVYLERNDLAAARECYQEATRRGPELFRPRHNLAAALLFTGDPAEALEEIAILDSLHPPTAEGSRVAVMALIELERWNEAGHRLVEALDRDPDDEGLRQLAERLIADHPHSEDLQSILAEELSDPAHRDAAGVILPMLEN